MELAKLIHVGDSKVRIIDTTITVKAGAFSPAQDYMERRIDFNEYLTHDPEATFMVECENDSMINAFIPPGAKIIVDRSLTPQNGDVVIAVLNGEFTLKFLKKNNVKCWLIPANRKYKEIEVTEEMNMQVWGVVTYIIIDTKNLRKCML